MQEGLAAHTFAFYRLLETVRPVRERIPAGTQIVVNIGDFDATQAAELHAAGVNGAYHVCRRREGIDTKLNPEDRKETIRVIRNSGLDGYYCCEPVGPEHTVEELVEQMFLGIEYGCFQHAAMRRVYVPGAALAHHGQITELRLAQVTAVVALATLACPETRNIAVHEPNVTGLTSGANVVYAETGANPRDTEADTAGHRGRDVAACKTMLYEAGFAHLLTSPGSRQPLSRAYLRSSPAGAAQAATRQPRRSPRQPGTGSRRRTTTAADDREMERDTGDRIVTARAPRTFMVTIQVGSGPGPAATAYFAGAAAMSPFRCST